MKVEVPGFDPLVPPRARNTDPATSHQSAALILPRLGAIQKRVYLLYLQASDAGLTQHEAIDQYRRVHGRAAESTVRTRVSELVDAQVLRDSGRTRPAPSGQPATVWVVA